MAESSKFKDLLQEMVGGVVSTPAINSQGGLGYTERSDKDRYGFEFNPDGMPHNKPNKKSAFAETSNSSDNQERSVVIYEDNDGAITLKQNTPEEFEVVVREGSKEKVFEIDRDTASKIQQFFS